MHVHDDTRPDYLDLDAYGYERSTEHWSSVPSTYLISIPAAPEGEAHAAAALDLACGQGRNTSMLAARGYAVTAIDSSPLAIRTLNALRLRNVDARVSDIVEFSRAIAQESFAVILCNHGIQYLADDAVLDEMLSRWESALTAGGVLALAYFTEPRSIHPANVQSGALLVKKEALLRRYLDASAFDIVFFQSEVMEEMHDGEFHRHAVERLIVRKR